MTETVDQAQTRPPRALAGIIEDAWRATGGHCRADSPGWACSFSGTGPHGLHWPASRGPAAGGHQLWHGVGQGAFGRPIV